jgi:hypothetical protein
MTATPQERALAYIRRMPVSVAGQGGDGDAFNAAVAAVRGFDLSDADALDVLRVWNADCLPPWSEADLRRKIKSSRLDGQRPFGYLLDAGRTARPLTAEERKQAEERRQRAALESQRQAEAEAARKAAARSSWPTMRTPTAGEIVRIAELRHLPVHAVLAAARLGWLKVGQVDRHACFILTEGTFAQARRLDGQPLALARGDKIKAKALPGSEGHFLGLRHLGGPAVRVLLVEGCIALLEGLALLEMLDPAEGWAVVAATSASSRFASDPAALAALAGRRVTLILDNDAAGEAGAATWLEDLRAAGCDVKAIRPPPAFKDLGDHLAADPAPAALADYLK